MTRIAALDSVRGGLLLVMALNHVPSDLRVLTDQPLGFFSAPEGFVFVSGLLAGKIYCRRVATQGFDRAARAAWQRAGRIYGAHAICIALVFAWSALHVTLTGAAPHGSPALFSERPLASLLAAAVFVYRPGLFDILPLYCACLAALPLLLLAIQRGRIAWLLSGSVALWLGANLWGGRAPYVDGLINTGAIRIAAWQLLFVLGALLGARWAEGRLRLPTAGAGVLLVSLACTALFVLRHGWLGELPPSATWLTDKINLAPLRLLNLALAFYLFALLVRARPQRFACAPLELLGRNSLAVFTAHVVVAEMVLALPQHIDSSLGRALSNAFLIAAMFATARYSVTTTEVTSPISTES